MNIVLAVVAIVWSIRFLRNTLAYTTLWFVKEYRFDRMRIHLAADPLRRIFLPAFRIPPKSPKTIALTAATLILLAVLFVYLPFQTLLTFLIVDLVHFLLTAALVALLWIPTGITHGSKINKATQILRAHPSLFVVGVTGSFGKTSVKDYAASILSSAHTVLKTEASKNSPIGIAEVVLTKFDRQELFVVEMGAYKQGEIREMAALVRPQVGVVTAINAQHQDLFGTIENTMAAKYELIAGLTGRKIAILNADDARVRSMGTRAREDGRNVWWYTKEGSGIKYHVSGEKTFRAKNIRASGGGIEFQCALGKEEVLVSAPVVGEHQVSNVLAAIAVGVACGMSLADAGRAAAGIVPVRGVLSMLPGVNGSTFIDDTFNNNPEAAKAALDVLSSQPGRKVLVFQPMIELGGYAKESHHEVGAYAARVCDAIILTNPSWQEDFLAGVRSVDAGLPVHVYPSRQAAKEIQNAITPGDTVLFKGKEAGLVFKALQKP
jgi:UDP-N-acetylmuramoyl-tripeptide--D-alanyl-D-alanine ligase